MISSRALKFLCAAVLSMTLAACDSIEERAEKHYQSGLALMEAGDLDRAVVEFRNVFELNPSHRDARHQLAQLMLQKGNRQEAYSQYLRLVEQYPRDLEGRQTLSEIAFEARNWEELDRHGAVAEEIAPEDPRVKTISIGRAYRAAVLDEDNSVRRDVTAQAEALLAELPDNAILQNVMIDSYLRDNEFERALSALDKVLETDPDNRDYYNQRLAVLGQMGNNDAAEAQLIEMIERFPDDRAMKTTLLRYYMSRQDVDKAEAFLRDIADPTAEDLSAFVTLIQFLAEVRGPEAARVEIDRAIDLSSNPDAFRAMRAGFDFADGDQDKAVAELEDVLKDAEPSEQTRGIQVTLARMLLSMGNEVGARRLVEAVLAEDETQVDALKMQAGWHIEADDTDAAISALRVALDNAPEDAQAMTLMAEAYTRAGSHELARDFLSLAVEASGNAPAETIRYARLLIGEKRYLPAEDILKPALRLAPNNVELMATMGQLYLVMEDVPRTEQVIAALRRLDDPAAPQAANAIEAELLNQRQGTDEALAFLQQMAEGENADLNSKLMLVRARLSSGKPEEAMRLAEELVAENPGNDQLRFALAATRSASGDVEGAVTMYQDLLKADPSRDNVWLELSRALARLGKPDEARSAIDDGLAASPQSANLQWAKASYLEQDGNIDGAIAIYEKLYEQSSGSVIVANNLASLLATHREDDESLKRAYTVARRLQGTDNPALQDTYGWILYRRGDHDEAVTYLEPAAAGIPQDALVQYHLGMAYAALNRNEEAIAQLQKAIDLAGVADTRPQIEAARAELNRLRAP